jgi:hypothetical protein
MAAKSSTKELLRKLGLLSTQRTFLDSLPYTVTAVAAAAGSNVSEVTFTVRDANGAAIAAVHHLDIYLSDAATGAGLTATSASGTVTAKTSSGAVIHTQSAKKALGVQTLATGVFVLEITDTAKTTFYPVAILPSTGKAVVGTQLTAANYG